MEKGFNLIPHSKEEQIASDAVDKMYIDGKAFELFQILSSESDMSFEDAIEYIQREDGPLGKEDLAAVIEGEAEIEMFQEKLDSGEIDPKEFWSKKNLRIRFLRGCGLTEEQINELMSDNRGPDEIKPEDLL